MGTANKEIVGEFKIKMPEIIKSINIQDGEYSKIGEAVNIKGKGINIEFAVITTIEKENI